MHIAQFLARLLLEAIWLAVKDRPRFKSKGSTKQQIYGAKHRPDVGKEQCPQVEVSSMAGHLMYVG